LSVQTPSPINTYSASSTSTNLFPTQHTGCLELSRRDLHKFSTGFSTKKVGQAGKEGFLRL